MDNDPHQENKQAPSEKTASPINPPVNGLVSGNLFPEPQAGEQYDKPVGFPKLKKILTIVFGAQIIFYLYGLWISYDTRNANDFSGLGAILPLGLSMILLWGGAGLFVYYFVKCRKVKARPSIQVIILFVLALSTMVFHETVAFPLTQRDKPYGGYGSESCSDQECMSRNFSKCLPADYTAKVTINKGTPEEAVVTTKYDLHSPLDESHCQINIKSLTETPFRENEDGTRSRQTLKNETLYCEVDNSRSFEKYAEEIASDPSRHKCS